MLSALLDLMTGEFEKGQFPGILQARTLEWVAISLSNAWKWKVKAKSLSHVQPLATPWTAAHQAPLSKGFSRQEYWSEVPLPSPVMIMKNTFSYSIILKLFVSTTNVMASGNFGWKYQYVALKSALKQDLETVQPRFNLCHLPSFPFLSQSSFTV